MPTGGRWRRELKGQAFPVPNIHHGLEGNQNGLMYDQETAQKVREQVLSVVEGFATYSPGRHCRRGDLVADHPDTLYLPPVATKAKMWRDFCKWQEENGGFAPSEMTYRNILKEEFGDRLQFFHRRWGECNTCKRFSVGIGPLPMNPRQRQEARQERRALDGGMQDAEEHMGLQEEMAERQELYARRRNDEWNEHLDHARECRHRYSAQLERARSEFAQLQRQERFLFEYCPHYTWDFAAPFTLPLDIHKPGLYDFVSLRFVRCFGILDDGSKQGHHQLFWEYEQHGNPEVVISLADRFLRQQRGVRRCVYFCAPLLFCLFSDCPKMNVPPT